MLVVIDHFILIFVNPSRASPVFTLAVFLGSFGVGTFFLLSGFLIPISLNKGSNSFLIRRIFRIYPVAIAGSVLAYILGNLDGASKGGFLKSISLFDIFLEYNEGSLQPIYWTLTVEVTFYLIAIVFSQISQWKLTNTYSLLIGFNLLIIFLDNSSIARIPNSSPLKTGLFVVSACLPMLLIGWIVHLWYFEKLVLWKYWLGIALSLLSLLQSPFKVYFSYRLGAPSWIFAFFVLLWLLKKVHSKTTKATLNSLVPLSQFTYASYVLHVPIAEYINSAINLNTVSRIVIATLLTYQLTFWIHKYIEVPGIKAGKVLIGKIQP